jgi:uncharacterized membrane protein
MNRSGDVVGTIANASTGDRYAALWRNGRLYNLNDVLRPGSGWRLSIAFAINDRGEIAGVGEHAGHGARAFLLVPHSRGQDRSLWLRERGGSSR